MDNEKTTVFISHAAVEKDNYFSSWLKSKLELLGYKVWCDIEDLSTGSFWSEIDRTLQEETIKFIPVVTKAYVERSKNPGTGVGRELARLMTLLKDNPQLVIPIRIDDTDWNTFDITITGFQGADFSINWAVGLKKLVKYLEDDKTPKLNALTDNGKPIIDYWYKALNIKENLLDKEERYYTNWFPVSLPEKIFIYDMSSKFENSPKNLPFVYKFENNLVITFCEPDEVKNYFEYDTVLEKKIEHFFKEESIHFDNERQIINPNKKLVELLNRAITDYMSQTELSKFLLSGNKEVFFTNKKGFISLKHLNKTQRILSGKKKDANWHFACELNSFLYPIPAYSFVNHIVFTDENYKPLEDKRLRHRLRRKVGKDWYNREWFEKMLAMMSLLSNTETKIAIIIPVSSTDCLNVSTIPFLLNSKKGYNEPE